MSTLPAPATKIDQLFALEKITPQDIKGLTCTEHQQLAKANTQNLARLKGEERDHFLNKIDLILSAGTKSDIWEYNHSLINNAVADYLRRNGAMPNKSYLARETGLSRATITKHFVDHKKQPEHLVEMEQFKFMAPNVLANVCKQALNGDIKAARLYLQMVGATSSQPAGTVINGQNNYIQINNTKLSQENLEQLSAEQLNQIENIITNG